MNAHIQKTADNAAKDEEYKANQALIADPGTSSMNTGVFGTMDFTIADVEDAQDKRSRKQILAPQVA